ncbi:leucine--tRNA ligase [Candidatus Mycoplasma haematobovis]|uniref:leucine--tRNA ligase n=1 Tax=Candidatus Mycoplasma haematobovis TaxID=432608 RepID=A0A1A9QE45_9MOLU|nr:class I tRNA ligase family protein [Candidatus Mycoplasma haematobovis]OAL10747.1 leucine--tRNA ligase [Candidatus Mycoplasma haematobovis]
MGVYDAKLIEEKWIDIWEKKKTYKFLDHPKLEKKYILDMFPYPSGAGLHVGHLKGYLATDILTRYYRMKGYVVFHPMGWDAFGLPAEQYAIQTGNSPADFTLKNINAFRKQLKRLALSYDFEWEINTSDALYYQHTQWIFSQMYKHGLAELRDTLVNWCEELNTVLADEEIIEGEDGKRYSERGGYEVVPKRMKQWVLRITAYADELLEDLKELDWPENIKKIQENWIGKGQKYQFAFEFENNKYYLNLDKPSDILRLKAVGIHAFSKLREKLEINENLRETNYLIKSLFNNKELPIHYIKNVDFRTEELLPILGKEVEEEVKEGFVPVVTYKLKDWVFSRQRYWGEPIPIVFDKEGKDYLDEELPVVLPTNIEYSLSRNGSSPLINCKEWLESKVGYIRESSTMPNWAGSSWYFIAYLLKKEDGSYYDLDSKEAKAILKRWLPVDIYVGGQEHAAMHLLYARFWNKFLYKLGIVEVKEPFKVLFNQGMVLGSDGSKMSKSKGNSVNIDEIVDKYGSDALRVYEAFSGPTSLSFKWEEEGLKAMQKWLGKVYYFFNDLSKLEKVAIDEEVNQIENKLIRSFEQVIPSLKVNMGVTELMIFINELQRIKKYSEKALVTFLKFLSYYAPALAEELYEKDSSIYDSPFPTLNEEGEQQEVEFKVFIKGKFKYLINIPVNLSESEIIELIQKEHNSKIVVKEKKGIILVL